MLTVFAVSRILYYAAGVRFDARPLGTFFQIFDPVLLEHRLAETLWYAHTQPPGFNLMLGVLLKLSPDHFAFLAHLVYIGLGIAIMLAAFELMRAMQVSPGIAAAAAALFIVSPGMVLFENLLIYEYPILALMCIAALCWHRLFEHPAATVAFGVFSLLLALVAFRSVFHLFYMALAVAVVVYAFPRLRAKMLAAAALPLLLAFGLYAKNWVLYRQFTGSTWMGFNIYTITTHQLTPEEMDRFIAKGKISPVERIETLGPIADYAGYIHTEPPRGIPVLDQELDSTGRPNFNNPAYFQLHRLYLVDGKYVLLHYPKAYVRSLMKAWFAYFLPTSDFPFFGQNRAAIRPFDRWFNAIVFGQFKQADNRKELRAMESRGSSVATLALYTGTFLIIGLPLLFAYGCRRLWHGLRHASWRNARNALLAFMLFHIVMITAVVNLLSSFENNRYRLPIDGFFLVLAAMAVDGLIARSRVPAAKTDACSSVGAN